MGFFLLKIAKVIAVKQLKQQQQQQFLKRHASCLAVAA